MGVQDVIAEFFPEGLVEPDAFENWVSPLRTDAYPGAADLLDKLEKQLEVSKTALSARNDSIAITGKFSGARTSC